MFTALLIGFLLGFAGSMPVAGPIGILVLGRGLQGRTRSAMLIGAGAAIAEGVYAYLAFWGFSRLLATHAWVEPVSRGLAASILLLLGARLALHRPTVSPSPKPPSPVAEDGRSFLLGLAISGLNPTLMVTWSAAVTALHSLEIVPFSPGHAAPFSIGVGSGIAAWFAVLPTFLLRFQGRLRRATLDVAIRWMGLALLLLGLFFAVRFVAYLRGVV
ncbi:MAG: LysE family transporter [Polyangiales bacterium]